MMTEKENNKSLFKTKLYIYSLVTFDDNDIRISEKIFSISMLVLIFLNVFAVIAESFQGLSENFVEFLNVFEVVSIAIFTIEYTFRIWTADILFPKLSPTRARLKYIFSFLAIIDLLSILPFYIPFLLPFDLRALRIVRIIRLFRLFKVSRFTRSIEMIGHVIKDKASALLSSISIMLILLTVSATLMYNVECAAQPDKFVNIFSGFWWAIATLTTVGYGDIYPITVLGKLLSAAISILGIGIVALPTGILSAGFIEELSRQKKNEKFCPHCGGKL